MTKPNKPQSVEVNEKPQVVEVKENPLTKKLMLPGQVFRLPSLGLFYKNGELDDEVIDGEVEVYPMKTIDEINMKTPDMIFQGSAIRRVFERCIPQIKKPMELLSTDVDFLMGCLRRVSYGNDLPVKYMCDCEQEKGTMTEYNVPLDALIVSNTKSIDPNKVDEIYSFSTKLGNGVFDIQLSPMVYRDVVKIYQYNALELGNIPDDASLLIDEVSDAFENSLITILDMTLMASIVSVDGIEDRDMLQEWCSGLVATDRTKIMDKIASIEKWGTDFSYKTKCKLCQKDIDLRTVLDPVGFFTLPSSPTETK